MPLAVPLPRLYARTYTRQLFVPIYHVRFLLSVSDDAVAERKRWSSRFGDIEDDESFLAMTSRDKYGGFGVFLTRGRVNAGVIAHEAFHLAHRTMEYIGQPLRVDAHEAHAYLVQWFADQMDLAVVKAGR